VERGGKVRSFHVPNVTANNLYPIVARHTHMDCRFMTDDTSVYSAIGKTFKGGYETYPWVSRNASRMRWLMNQADFRVMPMVR